MLVKIANGPMCPYSGAPGFNEAHRLYVGIVDTLYRNLPKDKNNEIIEDNEATKLYAKLEERFSVFMMLYQNSVGPAFMPENPTVSLYTYWWQCTICGFILPVTGRDKNDLP